VIGNLDECSRILHPYSHPGGGEEGKKKKKRKGGGEGCSRVAKRVREIKKLQRGEREKKKPHLPYSLRPKKKEKKAPGEEKKKEKKKKKASNAAKRVSLAISLMPRRIRGEKGGKNPGWRPL